MAASLGPVSESEGSLGVGPRSVKLLGKPSGGESVSVALMRSIPNPSPLNSPMVLGLFFDIELPRTETPCGVIVTPAASTVIEPTIIPAALFANIVFASAKSVPPIITLTGSPMITIPAALLPAALPFSLSPTLLPSRSLNPAIEFLAIVVTGFCPVIFVQL